MVNLQWNGDDFRNNKDSSGSTADLVSHSGKLQQGYQHGSLTQGLVAYYPMEKGEGEVLHDGALNNLGQINGASWISDNQRGTAISFKDSENDHILTGTKVLGDTDFTITAWIKIESFSDNYNPIVCQRDSYSSNDISFYEHNKDLQILVGSSGDTVNIRSSEAFSTDTWYHVAVTRKGNEYQLFVDKNKLANGTGTGSYNPTDQLKIGTFEINGSYFDGQIKDVRIYDRALSQPEIKALYNLAQTSGIQITEKKIPNQNDGGTSRYKFNGTVNDSWGDNDGTDNTSKGYEEAVYAKGKSFDGDDDWVDLNETFLDGETHFTVSEWFKPESTSYTGIFGIWDNNTTSNRRVQIFWRGNDSSGGRIMQFLARDNSGNLQILDGNTSIEPGTGWHHIAITYDGNKQRLYINGKIDSQQEASFTVNTDTTYTDRISETPGNNNYRLDGAVDELRIYKTALKPQQIEKLYHKGAYRIPRRSTLQ